MPKANARFYLLEGSLINTVWQRNEVSHFILLVT